VNMPRSRKSVKRVKQTVVKQNKKRITKKVSDSIVGSHWKEKKTLRANYASMGLAAVVNDDSAVAVKVNARTGTLDPSLTCSLALGTGQLQVAGERPLLCTEASEPAELKDQVMKELEDAASCAAPPRVFMFEGDQDFVEKIIAKHGDNYVAMARDIKLNTYQLTPAQLRKKVERYHKYLEERQQRGLPVAGPEVAARRAGNKQLPCSAWNTYPRIGV